MLHLGIMNRDLYVAHVSAVTGRLNVETVPVNKKVSILGKAKLGLS